MKQQDLIEKLEILVDAATLSEVVLALARVCNDKAEHLRCNWQDGHAAKTWDRDARRLDKVAEDTNN